MIIEKPSPGDIAEIQKILQESGPEASDAAAQGFIRTKLSNDEIERIIQRQELIIAREGKEMHGVLWCSKPEDALIKKINFDLPLPSAMPLRWIELVAVARASRRSSVGRQLYEHLILMQKGKCLLTALYEEPLNNKTSKKFHLALDFQRIGSIYKEHDGTRATIEAEFTRMLQLFRRLLKIFTDFNIFGN